MTVSPFHVWRKSNSNLGGSITSSEANPTCIKRVRTKGEPCGVRITDHLTLQAAAAVAKRSVKRVGLPALVKSLLGITTPTIIEPI